MPLAPVSPVSWGHGSCLHLTFPQVLGAQVSTVAAKQFSPSQQPPGPVLPRRAVQSLCLGCQPFPSFGNPLALPQRLRAASPGDPPAPPPLGYLSPPASPTAASLEGPGTEPPSHHFLPCPACPPHTGMPRPGASRMQNSSLSRVSPSPSFSFSSSLASEQDPKLSEGTPTGGEGGWAPLRSPGNR